jgi:hypothetical protein
MDERPDWIKYREIGFSEPHPDPHQARSAMLVLSGVEGVIDVSIVQHAPTAIRISYDLTVISLSLVEEFLFELGFHLDNSLLSKLKRALYHFTEENERRNLAISTDQDHNSTRDIFMRNYRCRIHGCRDERPEYWRRYL